MTTSIGQAVKPFGAAHGLPVADVTQVGSRAWLVVGWVFVGVGVVSFLVILADILRGYRQHMAIMNLGVPITGGAGGFLPLGRSTPG